MAGTRQVKSLDAGCSILDAGDAPLDASQKDECQKDWGTDGRGMITIRITIKRGSSAVVPPHDVFWTAYERR